MLFRAMPSIAREVSEASFSVMLPLQQLEGLSLDCDGPFLRKEVGVAAIVCDTTENRVRQGSCDRCHAMGGCLSRVTKP